MKRLIMRRAFLLLFCLQLGACAQSPVSPPLTVPPRTPGTSITAEQYRKQLQNALKQLRGMEKTPQRPLAPLLNKIGADSKVRRADGALQAISGDEWKRRALEAPGNATRPQVRAAISSLEARLNALVEWQRRDASGRYFAGADAQTRFNQLTNTDIIRAKPTALEEQWSRTKKGFLDFWKGLVNWLSSATPAPASRAPNIDIDPLWIKALFIASALALLGTIGYLVWRAVGNPFGRRGKSTPQEFFGDDEELLRLPPDELLERARAFARAGDFREALRHIYLRLLLQMDARGVWRYDARRTNWEHIELLRNHQMHSSLAAPLSDLTRRFDRVRYGGAACVADDWNRFEHDALELENTLKPSGNQPSNNYKSSNQPSGNQNRL